MVSASPGRRPEAGSHIHCLEILGEWSIEAGFKTLWESHKEGIW